MLFRCLNFTLLCLHDPLRNLYRNLTNQTIRSILNNQELLGSILSLKGWVENVTFLKEKIFLHISDGSGPENLQVVVSSINLPKDVTYASSVHVEGVLIKSPVMGQSVELVAKSINVIGPCDGQVFPFVARHKYSPQHTRRFLHLRPKTRSFASLLRLRDATSAALHFFFRSRSYLHVHTPILTCNDCEGGGEVFGVQPAGESSESFVSESYSGCDVDGDDGDPCSPDQWKYHYFYTPTFLTVSGQLHLEACSGAVSRVYNFGPVFRADSSVTSYHLSEFYMIEAEMAFIDSVFDMMQVMEEVVREVCRCLLTDHRSELSLYFRLKDTPQQMDSLETLVNTAFARLSYTDAVEMLRKHNHHFKYPVEWGSDLKKEHEMYLVEMMGDVPVFIFNFPRFIKPFYAKAIPGRNTVCAVDLLVPRVGELVGGSLREDDTDLLLARLTESHLHHQLQWYLDLRRFGGCPHGGFGMGFERFLMFLLATPSVKDTIPFPRWKTHCQT